MASSARLVASAIAVLVALLPLALAQTTAPVCPLSGLPAAKPVVPPQRCPAAAELSCCTDCLDVSLALQLVSSNLRAVVSQIDPGIGGAIDASITVCGAFAKYPQCMLMIESIVCGTNCNPDSGTYVKKAPEGNITMTVCPEYANSTYDACKNVEVSGLPLDFIIPDPQTMMTLVVSNVIKVMGVSNFNITIAPGTCFTGQEPTPAYTPCCDPLVVSPQCPPGAVDTTLYAPYINRTVDSAACMAGAAPPPVVAPSAPTPGAAPAPPAAAPAPPAAAPAPPAAAPAPPAAAPGGAPSAAPPTPSAAPPVPSAAPPVPSAAPPVISPGAPPTSAPSPTPASPPASPTPASPAPPASPTPSPASPTPSPAAPPPPPKSGAASAVSLMSAVAGVVLGAVVVMA